MTHRKERDLMRNYRARLALLTPAIATLALVLASCGNGGSESGAASDEVSGDVTVFAAASLTDAFTDIGDELEKQYPDANFRFNFAGSSTLAQQIEDGAPADVFASANNDQMQAVVDAGDADGEPSVFVQNKLQIVVPKTNPGNVTGIDDFADDDLDIALCAEEVPCGAASQEVFDIASITPKPDTLEKDVKAVLTKVELGEADAGLVYVTDVAAGNADVEGADLEGADVDGADVEGGDAHGAVKGIDFPEADQAINDYPIVAVNDAPNPEGAAAFVDYVTSDAGIAILKKYGFEAS